MLTSTPLIEPDTLSDTLLELLTAHGYTDLRILCKQVCGVGQFNFTTALLVGLDETGYERRYCYEHRADAQNALLAWNGDGHPPGPWIKYKGAGIDLLNPEFFK